MKTIVIYNGSRYIRKMHMSTQSNHSEAAVRDGACFKLSWDTLGIAASLLCMVHCLAVPIVVMTLPTLGANVLHNDCTHYLLAFFVTVFCVTAVVPGYLRHSDKRVLAGMVGGLALVLFATFSSALMLGETWEMPLITIGNLLVVGAHVFNRKLLACSH
jgi:hypothetical protein